MKRPLLIRVPEELLEKARREARKRGITLTGLICWLLAEFVKGENEGEGSYDGEESTN